MIYMQKILCTLADGLVVGVVDLLAFGIAIREFFQLVEIVFWNDFVVFSIE